MSFSNKTLTILKVVVWSFTSIEWKKTLPYVNAIDYIYQYLSLVNIFTNFIIENNFLVFCSLANLSL